jgi:hypothetical protein
MHWYCKICGHQVLLSEIADKLNEVRQSQEKEYNLIIETGEREGTAHKGPIIYLLKNKDRKPKPISDENYKLSCRSGHMLSARLWVSRYQNQMRTIATTEL